MEAPFIELQRVESTNNYATGLVHAGMAQHGTAVFAHHQTAGKGQRGKQWFGEAGANIALSIIIKPGGLLISQGFLFSMAAAIAVHKFIDGYTGDETKIKWPNDVYWRDRKTAGMLIENAVQGNQWNWAVAGIGINVNQTDFGEMGNRAASFRQITGKTFHLVELAKVLRTVLLQTLAHYQNNPGLVVTDYNNRLYKQGETVRLKKDARVFEAIIKSVLPTGELVVQHAMEERFNVGDVSWELL